MNIFVKNARFSGGAPLSILQYINIIRKNYSVDEVKAFGEFMEQQEYIYDDNGVKTIDMKKYKIKSPYKSFKNFMFFLKSVTYDKPNLLINVTPINCVYGSIVENITGVKSLYIQPGGVVPRYLPKLLKNKRILAFSEENKKDLINYGYNPGLIEVVANRMNFPVETRDLYIEPVNTVQILIISRLDDDKLKSVLSTVSLLEEVAKKVGSRNIIINILGDGSNYSEISSIVNKIHSGFDNKFIYLRGFVSNVNEFIGSSHIVISQGRGAIDAIYNKRVTIINNSHDHGIVNKNNIEEFSLYNFSGRNIKQSFTVHHLVTLVNMIKTKTINTEELKYNQEFVIKTYDINYAEEKIISIINKNLNEKDKQTKTPVFFRALLKYISVSSYLYLNLVINKLKNQIKVK
ncbi:hypothetical protein EPH95_04100 [Salicibibacter halophilus]|uniref:Glycosyltransferase n=1 Tax=Salicibibacter halophilus TaxID=2502791 RepID=A0A514LF33_9BACI|nr:glycosyltransferase family 4 protein [Salicibibacter halophilus]QDI90462.1 hypothetical protein EPH95_04100 [Salicibibacter halophilus]